MTPFKLTLAGCLAAALILGATAPAESQVAPPVVVDLTIATTPMDRTSSALTAAATTLSVAADRALHAALGQRAESKDKAAVLARLAKLALLDVPLTHFSAGLNHEFGHMARAREEGASLAFRLRGGPWSSNAFDLRCDGAPEALGLATYGGGFDAEMLLERRVWDRIGEEQRGGVNDAVFLLDGAIGRFYYVHAALSSITGSSYDDLQYTTGDPTRYVYQLVENRTGFSTRDSILATADTMRRRSWLNFADFALWGQALNLVNYVERGQESFSPRWLRVGSVGLSPFARYHLSPVAPQLEVGSHYLAGTSTGDASVRWTEPVGGVRLLGTSLTWSQTTNRFVHPLVRFDIWRDVTRKTGARIETGFTATRWPSRRAGLQAAVGLKTDGYVLGLPLAHTVYAQTGLRVRF